MRTVVLGDVHLGSRLCRCGSLARVLTRRRWDRLILNGDIFDDLNFRRLTPNHWRILRVLRDLGEKRELVWIRGNHDGAPDFLGHLLGVSVEEEYIFSYRGERVYVVHGDQFDTFQKSARKVRGLKDLFYGFAIWFDVPRKKAIQIAQRSTLLFDRAADRVRNRAVERARALGARYVVVGHTHRREVCWVDGVFFVNPSSWLTPNPAYVLFDDREEGPRLVLVREARRPLIQRALGIGRRKARPPGGTFSEGGELPG